jgi:transcriptional regulator with XRE-family HTH domain
MGKQKIEDPAMAAVRERFAKSGMTQQELGERMGYAPGSARQAVSQFLKSGDPQISMLRRFAKAIGISVKTLLSDYGI